MWLLRAEILANKKAFARIGHTFIDLKPLLSVSPSRFRASCKQTKIKFDDSAARITHLHKRQLGLNRHLPHLLFLHHPRRSLYTSHSVDVDAGGHLERVGLDGGRLGLRLAVLLEHGEEEGDDGHAPEDVLGLLDAGPDDGHELGDGRVDDVLVEAGDGVGDLLVEGGGVLPVGRLGHDGQGGGLVQAEDGAGDGEAAAPRPGVLDALVDAAVHL